jgi:hypothetical protein
MRLEVVNPLSIPGWDEALGEWSGASFFHTEKWARVLADSYGYKPAYLRSAGRPAEVMVPLMEVDSFLNGKRGVCLPFSDYSPPLFDGTADPMEALRHLVGLAKAAGWKYVEIRDTDRFRDDTPPFATYVGHVLDLRRTEGDLFAAFRDATRRGIRKARKEGVEARRSTSLESVGEFYRLHCMTRRDHGLPPQPWKFFRNVHEHVVSKGAGFVVLASREGVNIAGAVYFHFGGKALYKYGASDKASQGARANNLVMWEAIRWFRDAGCRTLCFGRTDPDHEGLLRFKDGWGTARRTIRYYRYNVGKGAYVAGSQGNGGSFGRIIRALPIPVLRAVGTVLYRHMG